MNFTPEQIELIVQRVFQQLQTPIAAIAPAVGASVGNVTRQVPPPAPTPKAIGLGVHVPGRVVTHELLVASAKGVSVVRIDAKAILTPSAHDYIRQNKIDVVRDNPATPGQFAKVRWQIIITNSTPQIAIAVEGLSAFGIACEVILLGAATEVAAQAICAICRGEAAQVVVFTEQPELVACLANRNERMCAASVCDLAGVERARRNLQANVLALDPTDRNVHELRTLLNAFRAA
jgi:hypothetical protein